jgi:hypothetical protein
LWGGSTQRAENDHAQQPPGVRTGDHEGDQRNRIGDPAREQQSRRDEHAEDDRARHAARHGADQH